MMLVSSLVVLMTAVSSRMGTGLARADFTIHRFDMHYDLPDLCFGPGTIYAMAFTSNITGGLGCNYTPTRLCLVNKLREPGSCWLTPMGGNADPERFYFNMKGYSAFVIARNPSPPEHRVPGGEGDYELLDTKAEYSQLRGYCNLTYGQHNFKGCGGPDPIGTWAGSSQFTCSSPFVWFRD